MSTAMPAIEHDIKDISLAPQGKRRIDVLSRVPGVHYVEWHDHIIASLSSDRRSAEPQLDLTDQGDVDLDGNDEQGCRTRRVEARLGGGQTSGQRVGGNSDRHANASLAAAAHVKEPLTRTEDSEPLAWDYLHFDIGYTGELIWNSDGDDLI